jgi:O-antigen/teichoic acid export membrane protein
MNTIALAVMVFSNSFIQVLIPVVTKAKASTDAKTINVIMKDGTKYVTILLSTVIFILVISAKEILKIYVGDDFVHLFGWVTLWLLTLLLSHRNAMTSMVFTENKLRSVVIMGSFAMVVAFTAYLLLVPKLGVGGVVIGFTLHELIHTLFYYIYFLPKVSKIHTKEIFTHSVLPVILILGITALLVYLLFSRYNLSEWYVVIGKTIVAMLLFAIVIWFVLLSESDRNRLLSFVAIKKADTLHTKK